MTKQINETVPARIERYRLAQNAPDFFADKRLSDLPQEAGRTPAILTGVEAQLAGECM
jgi:hypothetical protein